MKWRVDPRGWLPPLPVPSTPNEKYPVPSIWRAPADWLGELPPGITKPAVRLEYVTEEMPPKLNPNEASKPELMNWLPFASCTKKSRVPVPLSVTVTLPPFVCPPRQPPVQ